MPDETMDGQAVTDEMIRAWADEAEAGYSPETLRRRGRKPMGAAAAEVVPVRIERELLDALAERADAEHISRSEAIREAVRTWLHVA